MSTRRSFTKTKLSLPGARSHSGLPSSMPLIIPNNGRYDIRSNELRIDQGTQRTALNIVPETLELLKSIKRPVGVLSICGPCRSGKSYILSRLLGSSDAFALGHTMDSKTFGIWIGTTVLECDEFTLILMDSEGVDSTAAEERNDATILVLSVLLSSCLIYNSFGVPRHGDLTRMKQFVKLAESVIVSTNDEQGSDLMELKQHFPDFLWLLRDAHLTPTGDDGREISPTNFLLTKVLCCGSQHKESEADTVSRTILTVFPSVECRAIQAPSTDRTVMLSIAANIKRLDPQFNKEVEETVQHLYNTLKPKQGFAAGTLVDGETFVELISEYVSALNKPNAVPCIGNTWQAAIEKVCKECIDQQINEYDKDMDAILHCEGIMPMEEEALNEGHISNTPTLFEIHRTVELGKIRSLMNKVGHFLHTSEHSSIYTKDAVCAEFQHRIAVFSNEKTQRHNEVQGGILLKYARENNKISRTSCERLFDDLYRPIRQKIEGSVDTYTFENLILDLTELYNAYFRRAVGPAKWEVYNDKQSFIEQQKSVYQTLRGFKMETMEAQQKLAKVVAEADRKIDYINTLQAQLQKEQKLHSMTMQEVKNKFDEEQTRLCKELDETLKRTECKYNELLKANMQSMAEQSRQSSMKATRKMEALMMQVEESQRLAEESRRLAEESHRKSMAAVQAQREAEQESSCNLM